MEGGAGHTTPTNSDLPPHCRHDERCVSGWSEYILCYCLCLSECVQFIMEDAKKKKREWQQWVHDMKLRNLLQLRDSLIATASIHLMRVNDYKERSERIVDKVTNPL